MDTKFEPFLTSMSFTQLQGYVRKNASISMFRATQEHGTLVMQDAAHVGLMVPNSIYVLKSQREMAELHFSQDAEQRLMTARCSSLAGDAGQSSLRTWLLRVGTQNEQST